MKELQLITNILYVCTSMVALCFAIFIFGLLPIINYIDELEQVWAIEFFEIMVKFYIIKLIFLFLNNY